MENDELDAFLCQELQQTTTHSESINPNTISSWLSLENDEDICTSSMPLQLQEPQQTTTHSESINPNTISSLLNLDNDDDICTSSMPLQLQELENHLLHDEGTLDPSMAEPDYPFSQDLSDLNSSPSYQFQSIDPIVQSMIYQPISDNYDNFLQNPDPCFSIRTTATGGDRDGIVNPMDESTNICTVLPSCDMDMMFNENENDNLMVEHQGNDTQNFNGTEEEDPKPKGEMNSKNLLSERKRRKRLGQQLMALRSIVPNITKMDKRSVLVDALSYLRSIHEETARLQKELKEKPPRQPKLGSLRETCLAAGTLPISRKLAGTATSKSNTQITEIETEMIEDQRFAVKITCKVCKGAGADTLRLMESMGFEIIYASFQSDYKPEEVRSTLYIRVRKQGKITEEKLKENIMIVALRLGLTLNKSLTKIWELCNRKSAERTSMVLLP